MEKKTITPVDVIKKIIIALVVIVDAYPIFWLFTCAFKKSSEFVTKPSFALPEGLYLKNFSEAWTRGNMGLYFRNSTGTCFYCNFKYDHRICSNTDGMENEKFLCRLFPSGTYGSGCNCTASTVSDLQ